MKTLEVSMAAGLLPAFHAMSDENRLRILEVLREGEHCVCEMQSTLALGQSLLSHHLRVLREAGLVHDRRDGRWIHYSIAPDGLEGMEVALAGLRTAGAANSRAACSERECAP